MKKRLIKGLETLSTLSCVLQAAVMVRESDKSHFYWHWAVSEDQRPACTALMYLLLRPTQKEDKLLFFDANMTGTLSQNNRAQNNRSRVLINGYFHYQQIFQLFSHKLIVSSSISDILNVRKFWKIHEIYSFWVVCFTSNKISFFLLFSEVL